MNSIEKANSRRTFLKSTAMAGIGLAAAPLMSFTPIPENRESLYIIGPRKGYSPNVGTLLSTMEMMQTWLIGTFDKMSIEQLDYLMDEDANSIGAMAMHLAATEKYYQLHTFDGVPWGEWSDEDKAQWDVAMNLGEKGREILKGQPASYYIEALNTVREATKKGFAERNDEWLFTVDEEWPWGPTNNYCKWFHVCEHISNHRGQMKLIAKRFEE
jgi:uncharacterized damage-inducible protein DinB